MIPGNLCGSQKPVAWVEVIEVAIPVKGVRSLPAVLVYGRPGTELEKILYGE